jgi:hypothetical protein
MLAIASAARWLAHWGMCRTAALGLLCLAWYASLWSGANYTQRRARAAQAKSQSHERDAEVTATVTTFVRRLTAPVLRNFEAAAQPAADHVRMPAGSRRKGIQKDSPGSGIEPSRYACSRLMRGQLISWPQKMAAANKITAQ